MAMGDCKAPYLLVGGAAAMGDDEAVWSDAACGAARNVGGHPSFGQDDDVQGARIKFIVN